MRLDAAARPLRLALGPVVLSAALLAWYLVAWLGRYPEFILPRPGTVLGRLLLLATDGTLWRHASITAQEALGGFLLGLIFATLVGYPLAKLPILERVVSP